MTRDDTASVLFVDDEPEILSALARALDTESFDVRTCTDPNLALAQIERDPPSVVVADYYMPEMTGPEMLAKVREIDETIIRIILTGKPDVIAILEAVEQGAVYRFLLKPWDEDELLMSLRQAIGYRGLLIRHRELHEQLDRQRGLIERIESEHPGLTLLPRRDDSGAFVLTKSDLPE